MRTLGSKNKVWSSTTEAAAALGISSRQLRSLRDDLTYGRHYRSVSRTSAVRHTYQWDIEAIGHHLDLAPELRASKPKRAGQSGPESG